MMHTLRAEHKGDALRVASGQALREFSGQEWTGFFEHLAPFLRNRALSFHNIFFEEFRVFQQPVTQVLEMLL